jgi:hypothetical protein
MQAFALETLQGLSGQVVGLGLMHGLWISIIVASLVDLTLQVCPRLSHPDRHQVFLVALVLIAIGPVLATSLNCALSSSSRKTTQTDEPLTVRSGSTRSLELPATVDSGQIHPASEARSPRSRLFLALNVVFSRVATSVHSHLPFLVATWLVGVTALGGLARIGRASRAANLPRSAAGTSGGPGERRQAGPPGAVEKAAERVGPSPVK